MPGGPRYRDAARVSFWLDTPEAPTAAPPLVGATAADLVVVGGGYTGLWTALLAKEADPDRDIVLVEADRCGWGASGRNGGFVGASLTHGVPNGLERFGKEIETLERLGRANLDAMESDVARLGLTCDFARTGAIDVATEPYQWDDLVSAESEMTKYGSDVVLLDRAAMQAEVHSPTYIGGLFDRRGFALVDPARLAWGLRHACMELGVRIYEHTRVHALLDDPGTSGPSALRPLLLRTDHGTITARKVALGTNAEPSPIKRLRRYIVPVYDYVLMTAPLSAEQLHSIGWEGRQGLGGTANQFLYYRLSEDNRILFGGYDAIYHYGNKISPDLEYRPESFDLLQRLFDETFPQLDDVPFTHAWSGPIDTCSRFCAFFDRSFDGRVASAAGYTGLGVGATRFGAQVMLDLLSGAETELTQLELVRSKPLPFPPEPIRSIGINLTRWSLARADQHAGKRNLWLRTLDRVGLGFDS